MAAIDALEAPDGTGRGGTHPDDARF
jgi:hypothetical protein